LAGGSTNGPKKAAVKELSIWVVGDETAGYSDIITDFKAKFPQYG